MLSLSYSQISTYLDCPLLYKFQYIDRLPRKPKSYFSFGSTLHRCTQFFYKDQRKTPPTLKELLDFFERTWTSAGYTSVEMEEEDRRVGRDILTRFWEIHSDGFQPAMATEHWFAIEVEGIRLRGYIDKVEVSQQGGLIIIDYKTGKEGLSHSDVEESLQMSLYQLGAEGSWLLPVEKLSLYHLRTNSAVQCQPRAKGELEETKATVVEVAEGIEKKGFSPKLNHQCPCDYAESCPLYQQVKGSTASDS